MIWYPTGSPSRTLKVAIDFLAAFSEALERNHEVDRLSQETGIDPRSLTREQFWDAVADHVSLEEEARISEERFAALGEAMERHGEEPQLTGEPRSLEDLEREYRQEEAVRAAHPSTGGAGRPALTPGGEGVGEAGARPSRGGVRGGRGIAEEGRPDTLTEMTDQGEQIIMPGMERSAQQAIEAREAAGHGRIRPEGPQQEPGGLFAAMEAEHPDLFAAEQAFAAIDHEALLPEEREALASSESAMGEALAKEDAYREAGNCLKDVGL